MNIFEIAARFVLDVNMVKQHNLRSRNSCMMDKVYVFCWHANCYIDHQ